MGRIIGGIVGLALLTGAVAPAAAEARERGGGGYHGGGPGGGGHGGPGGPGGYYGGGHGGYHGGYHHRRHGDGGSGAAAVIGIAALIGAVAIVASSASKDKKARKHSGYDGDGAGWNDEDMAVNQCAEAAREQAARGGGYAEVVNIGTPQPTSDGWYIDGTVERRESARAGFGDTRRFTCSVRDGRVAQLDFSRDEG